MTTLRLTARNLGAISVFTLLAVASAYGQTAVLHANVPFGFDAHGTSLPAGTYQFKVRLDERFLVISGAKSGDVKLPIITLLGGGGSFLGDAGLVFDTFEGHHVLSEIWIPGQDGVLVSSTPKQHTHEMVIGVASGPAPNLSGKEVFQHTCARCHGSNGEGNPAADKFFKTPVPRLDSEYVQAKSDEELKDIIGHGRRMMDPVRIKQTTVQHLLSPESVDAVIRYVRTLKKP
jgi:cytochrome c5